MNNSVKILLVTLMTLSMPFHANAQFLKNLLKTVGEVVSNSSSSESGSSSYSRYSSPVSSSGRTKIPAIVFSNPSATKSYARSEGSIGTEAPDQRVPVKIGYDERVFSKDYAGNSFDFVITNKLSNTVTIYAIRGTKDNIEFPTTVEWKGKKYLVVTIGPNAIGSSVTGLVFPKGLKRIGYQAFNGCYRMPSTVRIHSSVTTIDAHAFSECQKLKSVYIPASVTSIGYAPFYKCNELEEIIVAEDNPNYKSVNGVLYNKEMTEVIQYPGGKLTKSYTAPSSVVSINREAFAGNYNLNMVVLPYGVRFLSVSAFNNARINDVILPPSIEEIGNAALGLESVSISGVPSKAHIIITANKPPRAYADALNHYRTSFKADAEIYVQKGTRSDYLSISPWSSAENIIETEFVKK